MRPAFAVILVWGCLASSGTAQGTFGGRVIAGQERPGILVSLVREDGQILSQAFTNVRGAFRFEGVTPTGLINDSYVYLVVEEEGFKPHRQRINQVDIRGAGLLTVFLEPEDSPAGLAGGGDGEFTVDLNQLQAEIPDEARQEYEDALEDIADGDRERAVERLERAVELAPLYYEAWVDLGAVYNQLGRYDDARTAFVEASEVNPAGALAPTNLGALLFQQGDREAEAGNEASAQTFSDARDWLERSIQLDPGSVDARYYLGAALYRLDLFPEAETMLRSAVAIDPQEGQARLLLINVYGRQNRLEDALAETTAFIDENPDAPQRAAIERLRTRIEDALEP